MLSHLWYLKYYVSMEHNFVELTYLIFSKNLPDVILYMKNNNIPTDQTNILFWASYMYKKYDIMRYILENYIVSNTMINNVLDECKSQNDILNAKYIGSKLPRYYIFIREGKFVDYIEKKITKKLVF